MFQNTKALSNSERASELDEMGTSSDDGSHTDSQRFLDVFSALSLAPSSCSVDASLAAVPPYALVDERPVVEISNSSFENKLADFYGGDIEDIAANPQRYSRWVSEKAHAQRTLHFASARSLFQRNRAFSAISLGTRASGF